MPSRTTINPTQKAVRDYYAALQQYDAQGVKHEGALRTAFQTLLEVCGRRFNWTLIPELPFASGGRSFRPDGTFRDGYWIRRGYWEAKDTGDDLERETEKKIKLGYPLTNTIFEDTRRALLFQNGELSFHADLSRPSELTGLLSSFFAYREPAHEQFDQAVAEFSSRVPQLAAGLVGIISAAHQGNPRFISAFAQFHELCRTSVHPNISQAAVDEMLVQHLLTERLIRKVFDNPDFTRRNVIAREVEFVIDALVSHSFNRDQYLRSLDRFYVAIEGAAETIYDHQEKQTFLNNLYERFFQGYSVRAADTHGIVYTPQPIVDFMCASVENALQEHFKRNLSDTDVYVLDPCTGTGNFIVNLLRRCPPQHLARFYQQNLFANEVLLMPYYIASLNIEHAYFQRTGGYEPFDGLCFVDTLDLAESTQAAMGFGTQANLERVARQRRTPITVIIGNPPYNVGQINENDNNKNRKYAVLDNQIRETYSADSKATLKSKLYDPYVRFFRWATERLNGRDGIVCLVTNNSFVDQEAFDGMRKHLVRDFPVLYHLDLRGKVRDNPERSGTAYNVMGVQVGVGITLAIHFKNGRTKRILGYQDVPLEWRREKKLAHLSELGSYRAVAWRQLEPSPENDWLLPEGADEFGKLIAMGSKAAKLEPDTVEVPVIFRTYSLGVSTNRDDVVYDFDVARLETRMRTFVDDYNAEVDRLKRAEASTGKRVQDIDSFVRTDRVKWSRNLKNELKRLRSLDFDASAIQASLYRPFTKKWLYLADIAVDESGQMPSFFPNVASEQNLAICVPTVGNRGGWSVLMSNVSVNLNLTSLDAAQCFPVYIYDSRGDRRKENITDWALGLFRERYGDTSITKWDIFYYVYGLLHHQTYRERFSPVLKKNLPRIPLAATATDFRAFAAAGRALAKLHIGYERLDPWPLKWVSDPDTRLSHKVDRMRLGPDKTSIRVNESLELAGIPPEAFDYRLGNRSALEWVLDQQRIEKDAEGRITSDPNRADASEYIIELVGRVVRVSIETARIVQELPTSYGTGL